jgi:hypothetical protein
MSNDLFKRNCAVLAAWYSGDCKEVLEIKSGDEWVHCVANGPVLPVGYELRIKPRTITVNGIEVPEPARWLKVGPPVWYVDAASRKGYWEARFRGTDVELIMLDRGLVHRTEEAAARHFEALIAPSKRAES